MDKKCAFCEVKQITKSYGFQCDKVHCERQLCENCADEPRCKECNATLLEDEKVWPGYPYKTRRLKESQRSDNKSKDYK